MNQPNTSDRPRPVFLMVLLSITALILGGIWFLKSKPTATHESEAVSEMASPPPPARAVPSEATRINPPAPQPVEAKVIENQFGIKIVNVKLTAEGHGFNVSYQVVDPDKAIKLGNLQDRTYIMDFAKGTKLTLTRKSLNRRPPKPIQGENYIMQFANLDPALKPGDKVAIVIDDVKLENLTLE
jgi:hypothetical protein